MPFALAAAPIFVCQSRRMSRLSNFRETYVLVQACKSASRAKRSFDFRPHLNPFAYLRSFSLFLFAVAPRFTRAILLIFVGFHFLCKSLSKCVKRFFPSLGLF